MSMKTCSFLGMIAGALAIVAGTVILIGATDIWPLVVGIPAVFGGVLGIAGTAMLSKNERAAGALLVAAAVASFVCLNLVSAIAFAAVRVRAFQPGSCAEA